MIALALAVAAGVVVDGTAAADARTSAAGTGVTEGAFTSAFVAHPSLSAALQIKDGVLAVASYTPQISVGALSLASVTVLHGAELRGELPLGPRLTLRGGLTGSAGALDAVTAASVDPRLGARGGGAALLATTVPYMTGSARLGGSGRVTRTVSLDVDGHAETTQSPGDPTIPPSSAAGAVASVGWRLTRLDALVCGADVRGGVVQTVVLPPPAGDPLATPLHSGGSFFGGAPLVGYRRDLGPGAGLELKGGYGVVAGVDGEGARFTRFLPTADARANVRFDLADASALDANVAAGIGAVNDALGALVEERATAGLGLAYRLSRQISFHVDGSAFGPAIIAPVGNSRLPLTSLGLGARGGIAWAFADAAALEVNALTNTRLLQNTSAFRDACVDAGGFPDPRPCLNSDVTFTVSIVATAPLFHSGGRPRGSDPRPGRDVGELSVGAAPPPGATTIQEVEPLPEEQPDDEGGEPPPPDLVPPPANVPAADQPIILKTLSKPPKTPPKKKPADDDKKSDAPAPPAPPRPAPAPAPAPPG